MSMLPARLFNAVASTFYSSEISEIIRSLIVPAKGLKLLDAPCGTGTLFDLCIPCDYYGADLDCQRVVEAQKMHTEGRFFCADSGALPLPDNFFDRILAAGLFHHVDDELALRITKEYARLLKPEGHLVVFEAIWPVHWYNFPGLIARKMDEGKYVRHAPEYDRIFSHYFSIDQRLFQKRLSLDYYLAKMSVRTDGDFA